MTIFTSTSRTMAWPMSGVVTRLAAESRRNEVRCGTCIAESKTVLLSPSVPLSDMLYSHPSFSDNILLCVLCHESPLFFLSFPFPCGLDDSGNSIIVYSYYHTSNPFTNLPFAHRNSTSDLLLLTANLPPSCRTTLHLCLLAVMRCKTTTPTKTPLDPHHTLHHQSHPT